MRGFVLASVLLIGCCQPDPSKPENHIRISVPTPISIEIDRTRKTPLHPLFEEQQRQLILDFTFPHRRRPCEDF